MPTKKGKPTVKERIEAGEITEDPRAANIRKGREKSPLLNKWKDFPTETAKAEYTKGAMSWVLQFYGLPRVHNDEEARGRIAEYFTGCAEYGMIPTVEELCMVLGYDRRTIWEFEAGRKTGPVLADTIKMAKSVISSFDARALMENKLNPVAYIFRAKNFYGMQDKVEVVASGGSTGMSKEELEEAAKQLPGE